MASLVAQTVKRLPAMRKTWVWSPGQEDPLEKEMATLSNIPAWKIPWTEVGYSPSGRKELDTAERLSLFSTNIYVIELFIDQNGSIILL